MPIGSSDAYQVYRSRYEHLIQPAVEGFRINKQRIFRCFRADLITKTGSITRDLLSRLYRSDAVIADLTDLNPNVFYELGVRHALRSGTILIALKGTKLPFDVGDLRVIFYEDRVGGEKELTPQIHEMLRSLLSKKRQQDSPVLYAIPELAELGTVKEHEARVAALERERDSLKAQLAKRPPILSEISISAAIFKHLCGIACLKEYHYRHFDLFQREIYFLKDNGLIRLKPQHERVEFDAQFADKNLVEVAEPTEAGWSIIRRRKKNIPKELKDDKTNINKGISPDILREMTKHH